MSSFSGTDSSDDMAIGLISIYDMKQEAQSQLFR
jgi:hypothetical protein